MPGFMVGGIVVLVWALTLAAGNGEPDHGAKTIVKKTGHAVVHVVTFGRK